MCVVLVGVCVVVVVRCCCVHVCVVCVAVLLHVVRADVWLCLLLFMLQLMLVDCRVLCVG